MGMKLEVTSKYSAPEVLQSMLLSAFRSLHRQLLRSQGGFGVNSVRVNILWHCMLMG
jgi:hypothetical protein